MEKVLYKRYTYGFYTAGSQAWKNKREKSLFLKQQRERLKDLVQEFHPSATKKYHLRLLFYLKRQRLGSDLDNMLKEFNDIVFGKNRDQRIYSLSALKFSSNAEAIRIWIYELST
jgi:Holliday junction resolvase RusA-like endonuclease